jgi:S1-C subfamily serine protease
MPPAMNPLRSFSDAIAAVVTRVRPAVLHLRTLDRTRGATGSGFLCESPGIALTNHHVIAGAVAVEATFHDGRTVMADVLGSDPATDLALLKVPAADVEPLRFAPEGDLRVGDFALAVGCPHGLAHSVAAGIISGLGRSLTGRDGHTIEDVVQTDAPLNPGNSGGPLLDADGCVVGIATAILALTQGLCFAIPAATARAVLPELRQHGRVVRAFLGVTVHGVELLPPVARRLGLPAPRALAVAAVSEGSPAADAGVAAGDLLVQLGEKPLRSAGDLLAALGRAAIGTDQPLRLLRDNEILTVHVRPSARPAPRAA